MENEDPNPKNEDPNQKNEDPKREMNAQKGPFTPLSRLKIRKFLVHFSLIIARFGFVKTQNECSFPMEKIKMSIHFREGSSRQME